MSNTNRVQAGIPEGGQWSESVKARPRVTDLGDVGQPDDTTEPIPTLDVGETHQIEADGEVFDRIEVVNPGDGGYLVTGTVRDNFFTMDLGPKFNDSDVDEKEEYLNHRSEVIDSFFVERFGDSDGFGGIDHGIHGPSWDAAEFEFSQPIAEQATEGQAAEALWENTSAVAMHNEMDPGTYGSDDATSVLRERLAEFDRTRLPAREVTDEEKSQVIDGYMDAALAESRDAYIGEHPEFSPDEVDQAWGQFTVEKVPASIKDEYSQTLGPWLETNSGDVDHFTTEHHEEPGLNDVGRRLYGSSTPGSPYVPNDPSTKFDDSDSNLEAQVVGRRLLLSAYDLESRRLQGFFRKRFKPTFFGEMRWE